MNTRQKIALSTCGVMIIFNASYLLAGKKVDVVFALANAAAITAISVSQPFRR
jgi:hypothetical protein